MCNCTSFCFLWRRHSYMPHHIQGKRYQCPHDPKRSSWINPQFPHLFKWQWQPRPQYTSKCISNVWLLFRWEQYQTSCFCPIWWSFFKIWQWCIAIFKRQKQTFYHSTWHNWHHPAPWSDLSEIAFSSCLWQSTGKVSWRYSLGYG